MMLGNYSTAPNNSGSGFIMAGKWVNFDLMHTTGKIKEDPVKKLPPSDDRYAYPTIHLLPVYMKMQRARFTSLQILPIAIALAQDI